MRISVIGTGYVGLVSGTCFSEYGFNVTCVDLDAQKIAKLAQGISPIYEPGLDELIIKNVQAGRLHFTTDLSEAVKTADIIFIAVGTPTDDKTGLPELTQFYNAVDAIAQHLQGYTLVVVKSTVTVGTTRRLISHIAEVNPDAEFDVASNPEFLREGSAIKDFMLPDRIVAGIEGKQAIQMLTRLYEPICMSGAPLFLTSFESSELTKYAANSLLAVRIAFINEMADLCEKTGANIRDVARGIGLDKRIGPQFLQPGPGYGGSCFPKDTMALATLATQLQVPTQVVSAAIASNEARKQLMVIKITQALGGELVGKTIAVLGLTFKAGTDDMRESPSLVIIPALTKAGAGIHAYDPQGMAEARKYLHDGIGYFETAYAAMEGADAVVILTEWNEFRSLDLARMRQLLKTPIVVDLRNLYKRRQMMQHGFQYVSVGRVTTQPDQLWIPDLNPLEDESA